MWNDSGTATALATPPAPPAELPGLLPDADAPLAPPRAPAPTPHDVLLARPAPRRERRRTPRGTRLLLDVLVGATLMVVLHLFVIQVSVVKGHSMEPLLHDGDRLVVDRVSYNLGDVARGDVVILRYPRNPTLDFVKRVVAVPGDRVAMQHGVLLVNGAVADTYRCIPDLGDLPEQTVPEAHVFVLGDNRPISCDSREFGLVPHQLLKGKVRARFWPLANAEVF